MKYSALIANFGNTSCSPPLKVTPTLGKGGQQRPERTKSSFNGAFKRRRKTEEQASVLVRSNKEDNDELENGTHEEERERKGDVLEVRAL